VISKSRSDKGLDLLLNKSETVERTTNNNRPYGWLWEIAGATNPINDILSPRDSQRAAQAIRLTTRWLRSYKTN